MTYKEENIVNIAMRAAELLKEGKIQRDDISGHAGLTENILFLSELFEKQNAGVDFDAEGRDYWKEIDDFAEVKLMEMYGIEQPTVSQPIDIKVIIDHGIVEEVLKNGNSDVQVEVLDLDVDYEDYEKLAAYRKELYADKSFISCDYTVARFDEEPDFSDLPIDNVHVFAVAGSVRHEIFCGDWDECANFCVEHDWAYLDENEFQWDLEMVDDREATFPEEYHDAIEHYANLAGCEIENEYIRQHAEQLVICYQKDVDYTDFIAWTHFEHLLEEKLSFDEGYALACGIEAYPLDITEDSLVAINELRVFLNGFRAGNNQRPALDAMINAAANKASGTVVTQDEKSLGSEPNR